MIKFEAIILSGGKGTRVKKYTKSLFLTTPREISRDHHSIREQVRNWGII